MSLLQEVIGGGAGVLLPLEVLLPEEEEVLFEVGKLYLGSSVEAKN